MNRRWARWLVFAASTLALSSIFLVGLGGLIPLLVALSGNGEHGTFTVTAPNPGEHCFSAGMFVPDRAGVVGRATSMEGECSGPGTRVIAVQMWSTTEVYPASPDRLGRLVLSPALLTVFGIVVLGGWVFFLRAHARTERQRVTSEALASPRGQGQRRSRES